MALSSNAESYAVQARQSHARQPRPELRNFVRAYGQRDIDTSGASTLSVVPPRLEQTLEFQFGEPLSFLHSSGVRQSSSPVMIIGASTGGGTLSLPSAAASFAVFFQPTGFSRLFGVPMVEISHHVYDDAVLGFRLRGLHGQLADCDSFVRRVAIIEAFLLERAAQCVQSSSLEHLAAAIFADQGAVRVSGLACMQGLGLRQFERRFLAETGLQPKLYARIARFQSALDAKINLPTRPWIDIAHCLGYHDEMHLVRDFHGFTGSAPGNILSLIGDTRPTALVGL